jgi:ankyrin repeat protein
MMMEDWHTIVYLLLRCKGLDLTQKNNYGINASYLSAELVESERSKSNNIIVDNVNRLIINRDTFDICFKDQFGNSLLMNYIYFNQVNGLYVLLGKDKNLGNEVNLGRESPLIFATKLGRDECIKALIKSEVNLNYQDSLGNTALHYAVEANNRYIVSLLVFYKADKTIKNNKGLSPVELAKSLDYQKIIKYFKKPVNPAEILKKEKKKKNKGTMGNEKSSEYSEQFKTIIYHQPQCVPSSNLEFVNQMQKNGRKIYKALNYEGEAEVSISEVYSEDFTSEVNLPIVGGVNMGARKLGRDWDWDTTVDEVTGSMKGIFKFVENLL